MRFKLPLARTRADAKHALNRELIEAAKIGDSDRVRASLQAGASPSWPPRTHQTPLFWAIRAGSFEAVRHLIDYGADVNDLRGKFYPIWTTFDYGQFDILEYLIERGADVNAGRANMKPLMLAASNARSDLAEFFLDRGADIDAQMDTGMTALGFAALNTYDDIVSLLLRRGASVGTLEALALGDTDLARRLAKEASTRSRPPHWGAAHLMRAARYGGVEQVRSVVDCGVDVNVHAPDGATALMYSVIAGDTEVVWFLLSRGANPNVRSGGGQRALHFAAGRWPDIADLLRQHGARR